MTDLLDQQVIHELKSWPENFQAVAERRKRYEIRKADRDFKVGDIIRLREYKPNLTVCSCHGKQDNGEYTGRSQIIQITHITRGGTWGLPEDICVFCFA